MHETQVLTDLLDAVCRGVGQGANKLMADELGVSQATISKLRTGKGTNFDAKTLRMAAWIVQYKDEHYAHLPIEGERKVGQYIITKRQDGGATVITWRHNDEE